MKIINKIVFLLLKVIIIIFAIIILVILSTNIYMINYTKKYILEEEKLSKLDFNCITVLGASVKPDGNPSDMLADRISTGVVAYNVGASSKILMSGDNINDNYDEVSAMRDYAINLKVPEENIITDPYGLNTYDSMYRLKNIYDVKSTLIITQDYHLYRSIYIAKKLGIDAYGVKANHREYGGQLYRDVREILARTKDFFLVYIEPKSEVVGQKKSIYEN